MGYISFVRLVRRPFTIWVVLSPYHLTYLSDHLVHREGSLRVSALLGWMDVRPRGTQRLVGCVSRGTRLGDLIYDEEPSDFLVLLLD